MLMPSHAKNVVLYQEPEPLFTRYEIERQLNAMFSPYVTLRSGGYLVINQTEALVAIDVNSGKSTREFSIEETALNTNLEASDEIARQLKLRDLAGLIVIDFIDMEEKRNNRAVERRLKDALRFDRARIQVGRISHFGLLEMSRQRLRTGVLEGSTSQCPHCQGTGIIRSTESVALAVLRGLEDAHHGGRAHVAHRDDHAERRALHPQQQARLHQRDGSAPRHHHHRRGQRQARRAPTSRSSAAPRRRMPQRRSSAAPSTWNGASKARPRARWRCARHPRRASLASLASLGSFGASRAGARRRRSRGAPIRRSGPPPPAPTPRRTPRRAARRQRVRRVSPGPGAGGRCRRRRSGFRAGGSGRARRGAGRRAAARRGRRARPP